MTPNTPPPKMAPKAKSSPPASKTGKPPPKATPSPKKGPPISAAFHAPGAMPAQADMGPSAAPAPITQPGDVQSAYSRLDGRAIAQALLGTFAQAIAQPK